MTSKAKNNVKWIALAALVIFSGATLFWLRFHSGPLAGSLETEWVENNFPEKPDEDRIVPFGYTLGQWPSDFEGEPIVTKMTYRKGPPQKFIQSIVQQWKPVEVELTLVGPKTIHPGWSITDWKKCFQSSFSCPSDKESFLEYTLSKHPVPGKSKATWFDSLDPLGARGLHIQIDANTYWVDYYTVITEKGAAQNFILKYVKTPVGLDARDLLIKTLGGLKVKDDLLSSREWIQRRIQSVTLDQIRAIPDLKIRLTKLIQVQNWIFSLLTVDPTQLAPFFHLAGVTHILTLELMKAKEHTYENQEAWILNSKPLLEALISYGRDFENSAEPVKNMEALLQDILLLQQKMSGAGG